MFSSIKQIFFSKKLMYGYKTKIELKQRGEDPIYTKQR